MKKLSVLISLLLITTCMLVGCGGSQATDMESMNGGAISDSYEEKGDLLDYETSHKTLRVRLQFKHICTQKNHLQ